MGGSVYDPRGVPASRSRNQHTALPRSAHDPPPKLTIPSIRSWRADATASSTALVGTCGRTPSNTTTADRPSLSITRSPPSEHPRPLVVTTMTRRAPISLTTPPPPPTPPHPH